MTQRGEVRKKKTAQEVKKEAWKKGESDKIRTKTQEKMCSMGRGTRGGGLENDSLTRLVCCQKKKVRSTP